MVNPSRSPSSHTPLAADSPQASSATFQTPLPSIRHLHPYLPPSGGMSQQSQLEGTSYSHTHPTHATSRFESDTFGHVVDSENEDADPQGPPKKKRRRQALSCTECKRRKIKCDRNQPCAPCTRRGEQAKCQWHVVEPVEKYVSRAEYDELKMRFEHLENTVHRLVAMNPGAIRSAGAPLASPAVAGTAQHVTGIPVAGPDYQNNNQGPSPGYGIAGILAEQPVLSPSQSSQLSSSAHHLNTSSLKLKQSPSQQMMPPSKFLQQHDINSSESVPYKQIQQESLRPGSLSPLLSSRRPQTHTRQGSRSSVGSVGSYGSMRSPIIPQSSSGISTANSPVHQFRTLPNESSSLTSSSPSIVKNSPFSLASITSPFDSEPGLSSRSGPSDVSMLVHSTSSPSQNKPPIFNQSKNCYAQTLKLGERLRNTILVIPLRRKPCIFLPHIIHTLPILLMFHILTTHMSNLSFLPAQSIVIAVLSAVKLIIPIATLVPQGRTEEGLATLLHPRSPYRLPKQRCFMLSFPEQANPDPLRAWSLIQPRQ
ncbi:hypothetical protein J3R30DRAFT_3446241 [Lentinula aciculospora]|uniref:Zn(2)-C6 fungal-type domain-containing protein n=1 Tax=Lentinula aciculospora TaxID=153920 RepID=A0A9W9DU66_9AGAR|nr:hypothetical protein J3R30DRAFT_3446241 [Lentinula aciculospora]